MPSPLQPAVITGPHEFVSFLFSAFGLRVGRIHQLKDLRSPDELSSRIREMVEEIARHISGGNPQDEEKICVILDFMNIIFFQFNKIEILGKSKTADFYQLFVNKVILELFEKSLSGIALSYGNEIDDIKSGRMITHLSKMLKPSYFCNARDKYFSSMGLMKKNFKRGFGSDIKTAISKQKNADSIIKLKKIDKLCEDMDSDKCLFNESDYIDIPSASQLKTFWYSARFAEYLQKTIIHASSINQKENRAFETLLSDCHTLLNGIMDNNEFKIEEAALQEVFEKFSLCITKIYISRNEAVIIKNALDYLSPLDNDLLIKTIDTPIIHHLLVLKNAVKFLYKNQPNAALEKLHEIFSNDLISTDRLNESANKMYVALLIKCKKINIHYREYDKQARCGFLSGSSGFSFEKSDKDAFHRASESIFSFPSSVYALSSIQTYSEIIEENEQLNIHEMNELMIDFPITIEIALGSLYWHSPDLSTLPLCEIKKTLEPFKSKNCIEFIMYSSLYACLAELSTLCSFWPDWALEQVPNVKKFCSESLPTKRKVLLAISISNYKKDAELNSIEKYRIQSRLTENEEVISSKAINATLDLELDKAYLEHLLSLRGASGAHQ